MALTKSCSARLSVCIVTIYLSVRPRVKLSQFLFARRYASAVLAVVLCSCLSASVRHKPELYENEWTNQPFCPTEGRYTCSTVTARYFGTRLITRSFHKVLRKVAPVTVTTVREYDYGAGRERRAVGRCYEIKRPPNFWPPGRSISKYSDPRSFCFEIEWNKTKMIEKKLKFQFFI